MADVVRGTGWQSKHRPTFTAAAYHASCDHVGACGAATLPDSFCLSHEPWIQDQGQEESCTARMGVGMLYELTGERCSVYVPWWEARVFDAGGPDKPLQNVGCSTDGFLLALRNHGACPLTDLPSLGMLETPPAIPARLTSVKRKLDIQPIYASLDDAELAIRGALVQGYPCGVVVNVDNGYDHPAADGSVGPESGASRGQHAVLCDGYKTDVNGVRWYRSPGSWGTGYGVAGVVWLHQSRIRTAPFLGFATGVVSA